MINFYFFLIFDIRLQEVFAFIYFIFWLQTCFKLNVYVFLLFTLFSLIHFMSKKENFLLLNFQAEKSISKMYPFEISCPIDFHLMSSTCLRVKSTPLKRGWVDVTSRALFFFGSGNRLFSQDIECLYEVSFLSLIITYYYVHTFSKNFCSTGN